MPSPGNSGPAHGSKFSSTGFPERTWHETLLLNRGAARSPRTSRCPKSACRTTSRWVDLKKHVLADGTDYYTINPKGYVPLLELDDGTRLSEVAVILQYIADRKPGTLAPFFGTMERYRLMEWLNFLATEAAQAVRPAVASGSRPRRRRSAEGEARDAFRAHREDTRRAALPHGIDVHASPTRIYFTILNWAPMLKVDLAPWPALQQFQARVPHVRPCTRCSSPKGSSRRKSRRPDVNFAPHSVTPQLMSRGVPGKRCHVGKA